MAEILCIETTGQICSVALFKDLSLIAYKEESEVNSHAEKLALFIREIIQEGKVPDAVAISGGPGSYTGLRIGVSTAKGLCHGWNIPLIAIDTLQLTANAYLQQKGSTQSLLCPMTDARRMEVYCALYNSALDEISPPEAVVVQEDFMQGHKQEGLVLFGSGAEKCAELFANRKDIEIVPDIWPTARYLGNLAQEKFNTKDFVSLAYYEPFYLKEFQSTVAKPKL